MAKPIILRRLGKSDLMVSPIGLGCWQFSRQKGLGGKYWPFLEEKEILEIVRVSLEGGVNWFDTAEAYGMGESERALSEALRKLGRSEDEVIIATKWMPLFRLAKSIIKTIDRRIQSLNNYRIDLYQIHQPLSFSPIKAQMRAMARLVHERKIRDIGISNFSAKKMRKAHDELSKLGLQLISNQVRYSLLDRRIETNGILDTAKELGVSVIAYSPLAQGILSGKFHDDPGLIRKRSGYRKYMGAFKLKGLERSRGVVKALKELAEKYRVTPAQIALNWVINFRGDAVVAIPGATSAVQAKDNTGSMSFKLTEDDLHSLDEVSASFKI
jgi:aryl-alcohol dehydrogenase-like predicted oxidoreductase